MLEHRFGQAYQHKAQKLMLVPWNHLFEYFQDRQVLHFLVHQGVCDALFNFGA